MKKIFFALFGIAFTVYLCYAQPPAATTGQAPLKPVVTKPVETKVIAGTVDSVTLADPAKGIKSEIVVVDANGNKTNLGVKANTAISDVNSSPISLDKINKGEKVEVKYFVTPAGMAKAVSIKVVAQ